jgi:hypothetical protein
MNITMVMNMKNQSSFLMATFFGLNQNVFLRFMDHMELSSTWNVLGRIKAFR